MPEEYGTRCCNACIKFPDGHVEELPLESFFMEPIYSDESEMPNPADFTGTMTATFTPNPEVLALLFGPGHFIVHVLYRKADMRMHHRRRFPWKRRFR